MVNFTIILFIAVRRIQHRSRLFDQNSLRLFRGTCILQLRYFLHPTLSLIYTYDLFDQVVSAILLVQWDYKIALTWACRSESLHPNTRGVLGVPFTLMRPCETRCFAILQNARHHEN